MFLAKFGVYFPTPIKKLHCSIFYSLSLWCNTHDLTVNTNKSKIVHFRTQSTDRTDFEFMLNDNILDIVPHYMYLGTSSAYKSIPICSPVYK
jgi:hypothetical protein